MATLIDKSVKTFSKKKLGTEWGRKERIKTPQPKFLHTNWLQIISFQSSYKEVLAWSELGNPKPTQWWHFPHGSIDKFETLRIHLSILSSTDTTYSTHMSGKAVPLLRQLITKGASGFNTMDSTHQPSLCQLLLATNWTPGHRVKSLCSTS